MNILLVVLTGVMAGVYFAFSIVVMPSFAALPARQAAEAMNKINDVIVRTVFLPIFFITTVWYAGWFFYSLVYWQGGRSFYIVGAALFYLLGMFAVTVFLNVPMNNTLKVNADQDIELIQYWRVYLYRWTWVNHIRTVSCIASCALLTKAWV